MHIWRQKHPDHPHYDDDAVVIKKAKRSTFGELTDDAEVDEAAGDIFNVAAQHRKTVVEKDKAAKARRRARG